MTELIDHPILDQDRLRRMSVAIYSCFKEPTSDHDTLSQDIFELLSEQYNQSVSNYLDLRTKRWGFIGHGILEPIMSSAIGPVLKAEKKANDFAVASAPVQQKSNYPAAAEEMDFRATHEIMWQTIDAAYDRILIAKDLSCTRNTPNFDPPQQDKEDFCNFMLFQSSKYIEFLDALQSNLIAQRNDGLESMDADEQAAINNGIDILTNAIDGLRMLTRHEKERHPEYEQSAGETILRLRTGVTADDIDEYADSVLSAISSDYAPAAGMGEWILDGCSEVGEDGMIVPVPDSYFQPYN